MFVRCPDEDISATRGYSLPQRSPLYFNQGPCSKLSALLIYQERGFTDSGRNVIRSALPPNSHEACQGREFAG